MLSERESENFKYDCSLQENHNSMHLGQYIEI